MSTGRMRDVIVREQIIEYIKYAIWILFGSGVFFEITPLKIKPISWILSWIGRKINNDVREDIKKIKKDVEVIGKDLQDHIVESMRRDILNFADKLRVNGKRSKEEFDYIIEMHDRYEKYLEENNLDNGKVGLAFEFICEKYKENMDNNSFYTGK